jgi:hypothetical protein
MDYQELSMSMYPQVINLDVRNDEETGKTGKDTATEAFEPGAGVEKVTHAPDYEILQVTMGL